MAASEFVGKPAAESNGGLTQLYRARRGEISPQMGIVARAEELAPETVQEEVARGRMVIPANVNHAGLIPVGIGIAARCKVNANLGNSPLASGVESELEKLRCALQYGADTVMDLSTGREINEIRRAIIAHSPVPVGTVPLYQAVEMVDSLRELSEDLLLEVIHLQAEQGVDFMTLHCGILQRLLPLTEKRLTGIVSRGGSLTAEWMLLHGRENPAYTGFDRILKIARRYDVTLSLGDGLRPGCLHDAADAAQYAELSVLGELTERAWAQEVQVMIEGPGHVPLDLIQENVTRQQEICRQAPFYVLGPLVTDLAPGYDHISGAIGGALAAWQGASMLCYVTPKEHLGLPEVEDVRQGLVAFKIAAHAADVARKRPGARRQDDELSAARYAFDWRRQFELALDPQRAREYHAHGLPAVGEGHAHFCSMCGPKFCAYATSQKVQAKARAPESREN